VETWKAILFGAVGTWVVAVLAIWGERIRSYLFKPGIQIGKGEFSGSPAIHEGGHAARYYFVPVRNPTRFPPAHEVHLVLTRIERSGPSGVEILFDEIMPLSWVRQELHRLLTRTVGPDAIASLFFVQDDGVLGFTPALTPQGGLATHFPRSHKGPVILWATLRALSIEADSSSMRLKIDWNGQWRSDIAGLNAACRVTVDPL
jgi:hypothetical protein